MVSYGSTDLVLVLVSLVIAFPAGVLKVEDVYLLVINFYRTQNV